MMPGRAASIEANAEIPLCPRFGTGWTAGMTADARGATHLRFVNSQAHIEASAKALSQVLCPVAGYSV